MQIKIKNKLGKVMAVVEDEELTIEIPNGYVKGYPQTFIFNLENTKDNTTTRIELKHEQS